MTKKIDFLIILLFIIALKFSAVAENKEIFKVAYGLKRKLNEYDPANIQTALQATMLEQLYLRLVNYSGNDSIPVPSLATYQWKEKSLIFSIKDSKTKSGKKITATDAYKSLKRLMILDSNTHGDLSSMLCPGTKIINVNQKCKGLEVIDSTTLKITPHNTHHSPFLVKYFMNFDTSIIPSHAIDWTKKELPIIDYTETTGPYYIDSFETSKQATLKANTNSVEYSDKMPQTVQLLHLFGQDGIDAFKKNNIDHITNSGMSVFHYTDLNNFPPGTLTYETLPIELSMLLFNKQGLSRFTKHERQGISNWTQARLKIKAKQLSSKAQITNQLFPINSDAALSKKEIPTHSKAIPYDPKKKKIRVGYNSYSLPVLKNIFSENEVDFIQLEYNGDENTKCDLVFNSTDSSFFESLVLLNYNFSTEIFELDKPFDYKNWLNKYTEISDKKERLLLLRKLHRDLIDYSKIIPLYFLPYVSITKKPWLMNFSKYYAVNPFWAITKD